MPSTIFSCIAFCLLAACQGEPTNTDAPAAKPLLPCKVDAAFEQKDGDNCIKFTITNQSTDNVTVWDYKLPWNNRLYLTLILIEVSDLSGTELREVVPIADPAPTDVTIKPGGSVSGKLSLNNRFPDLTHVLKTKDVVVFWSYQLKTVDAQLGQRQTGWLLISASNGQ